MSRVPSQVWWIVAGAILLCLGLVLLPIVMLGLCGIPLGMIGLIVLAVGLLRFRNERQTFAGAAMGVPLLLLGVGLVPFAVLPTLESLAAWHVYAQRVAIVGATTPAPSPVPWLWTLLLALAAAMCITLGLELRLVLSGLTRTVIVAAVLALVSVTLLLFLILAPAMPLTA